MAAFCFSGASSTGKSTLAQAFANARNLEYRPFTTTKVIAEAGFKLQDITTLEQRVAMQEVIINHAEKFFDTKHLFVTDRSPFDFIGYLLSDVNNVPITRELDKKIEALTDKCLKILNKFVWTVVVIYPSLPYEQREDRPYPNRSYQLHHHHIVWGLANDPRVEPRTMMIPPHVTDLQMRLDAISYQYDMIMKAYVDVSAMHSLN